MVFLRELSLHSTLQHFFALLDYVAQSSVFLDDRDKYTSLESGTSSRALKPPARSKTHRGISTGVFSPESLGAGPHLGELLPRVGHIPGRCWV